METYPVLAKTIFPPVWKGMNGYEWGVTTFTKGMDYVWRDLLIPLTYIY